jgi:hypothetical protein
LADVEVVVVLDLIVRAILRGLCCSCAHIFQRFPRVVAPQTWAGVVPLVVRALLEGLALYAVWFLLSTFGEQEARVVLLDVAGYCQNGLEEPLRAVVEAELCFFGSQCR